MIDSERGRAVHRAVRGPERSPDPPHHGHRLLDALVGGGLLPDARRRRAVRDPLRPPRHRPLDHLRARAARIHRRRPGRRRGRRARRLRHRGGARGRRLGRRRVRANSSRSTIRTAFFARPHQHLSRDADDRELAPPTEEFGRFASTRARTGPMPARYSITSSTIRASSRAAHARSTRRRFATWCAGTSSEPATSQRGRTTICCRRASPRRGPCTRSRRPPSSSMGPRIRCSRSSTGRPSQRRSPAHACSGSRGRSRG